MIKAMIEFGLWLRSHNLDASSVRVTFEFEGPDSAARASRHVHDDAGRFPSYTFGPGGEERIERICGIDVRIVGRA